jgi:PDZ domain-containing protein
MKTFWLLGLNALALYFGVWLQPDQIIQMPGGLIAIEDRILLAESYEQTGTLSSVFIYSMNEHTLLLRFIAAGAPGVQIVPQADAAVDVPGSELNLRGRLLYDASVTASLVQAFTAAGIDVATQVDGLRVIFSPNELPIRIGALITMVDDTPVTSLAMFVDYIEDRDTITLNNTYEITRREDGFFGLTVMEDVTITSSAIEYSIRPTLVQGNSGGLMQTLSLYNRLTENDITQGRRIAGTGTINANGSVGPIGGVRQKVISAVRANVDVFFVPADDYAEALEELSTQRSAMRLVPVATFQEALRALNDA